MGIIRNVVLYIAFATLGGICIVLAGFPAERAYAGTYDISKGDITIEIHLAHPTQLVTGWGTDNVYYYTHSDDTPVITGSTTSNRIIITAEPTCTARVTLSNVTITIPNNHYYSGVAAINISGEGKAVIELDGDNTVVSGTLAAGVNIYNNSFLEIGGNGSLNVTGGEAGAGIGGGTNQSARNIKITGGTVIATGGVGGAGIGGGQNGACSDIEISGGTVIATGGDGGAGIGGGAFRAGSDITISNDARVMAAGGTPSIDCGAGATIGSGGQGNNVPGSEIDPDTSGLNTAGFIKCYAAGTGADAIKNGTATPSSVITLPKTITFDANGGSCDITTATTVSSNNGSQVLSSLPEATQEDYIFGGWYTSADGGDKVTSTYEFYSDTTVYAHWIESGVPEESAITVSDNKPMAVSTETKGDFKITYAHEIPFFGKGKITPEYFGGFTVSQDNATYNVTKIKVNKKKLRIQITGLSGADKNVVKMIKKATKGNDGLPFKSNPYYVRDTDKVTPKFNKKGKLKSVKVFINSKDYKAKKDEYSYDSGNNLILFKGSNLNGSYQTK